MAHDPIVGTATMWSPRSVTSTPLTSPEFIVTPAGFEELVRMISVPAESRSLPPSPQEPPDVAGFPALAASYRRELLDD